MVSPKDKRTPPPSKDAAKLPAHAPAEPSQGWKDAAARSRADAERRLRRNAPAGSAQALPPDAPPGKSLPAHDRPKPVSEPSEKKREQRTKSVKAVKLCPKCGAFMVPTAQFSRDGENASFSSDNSLRSFGGVEVRTFQCEKCLYSGQFQLDPFPKVIDDV